MADLPLAGTRWTNAKTSRLALVAAVTEHGLSGVPFVEFRYVGLIGHTRSQGPVQTKTLEWFLRTFAPEAKS